MRPRLFVIALAAFASLALGAVALADSPPGPAYNGPAIKTITSALYDGTGKLLGNVQLNQDAGGVVQIIVDASALPAGPHGIHFHAAGICEGPKFTTASSHFNPGAKKHGLASAEGPHAGDLPQVDSATVSQGYYTVTTDRISLTVGATSIFDADGTALVVHAVADDQVTDPTGNSGDRIACAVLAAPDASLATPTRAPGPPATGNGTAGGDADPFAPGLAGAALLAALASGTFVATRRIVGRASS